MNTVDACKKCGNTTTLYRNGVCFFCHGKPNPQFCSTCGQQLIGATERKNGICVKCSRANCTFKPHKKSDKTCKMCGAELIIKSDIKNELCISCHGKYMQIKGAGCGESDYKKSILYEVW